MSSSNENGAFMKRAYDTALSGDFAGFLQMLDENVVVYEPSYLPYGGVTRGREAFTKLFATIATYLSVPSIKVESVVADGDIVVAFLKAKTVDSGEEVDIAERSVVRNGRIAEMRIYYHEGQTLFPRAPRKPA
ncbi:MAG TPA: nuclear transport factor 2 family protein [Nevskiaceae bacterium]|nr:nuclear transport factor 2 family protein [Nevskiaceae bacterium]